MAKCPKCDRSVSSVTISATTLSGLGMNTYKGVVYSCPNIGCQAILSVGIDPVALKADTVSGVIQALKR